jgi:hypothetical protein
MSDLIAIEGYVLGIRTPGHSGTISINPGTVWLDAVTKIVGKKLLRSTPFAVTGFVGGGVTSGTGTGTLVAGAHKAKVKGLTPVTEADSVFVLITDANPPFGTTTTEVGVSNAAQNVSRTV